MDEPRRRFTIEEVNRTIPVLERRLARIGARFKQLSAAAPAEQDPRRVGMEGGSPVPPAYFEGVREIVDEGQRLEENGVIVRDLRRGLLDFPATLDGREVLLCWLRGERRVGYFHDADAGFAGRKPLPSESE